MIEFSSRTVEFLRLIVQIRHKRPFMNVNRNKHKRKTTKNRELMPNVDNINIKI